MKPKVKYTEMTFVPRCPHCEADLHEIAERETSGPLGLSLRHIFACPHCQKVLTILSKL